MTGENNTLLKILEPFPQSYLEEITNELYCETGKRFNERTIWRQMTNKLVYSLKVAIFHTRQPQIEE